MIVYYILVFVPIIVYLFLNNRGLRFRRVDNEETVIILFFSLYLLLLCLRDSSVGLDTSHYISRFFEPYKYYSWEAIAQTTSEIGFGYLTKAITLITSNPQVYLSIIAIITVMPLIYFYRREATSGVLCVSIFLITLLFEINFSGLRQGIAIAMAVPAYYYSKNKKLVPFILTVALAMTFHRSSFILALIYPIYHAKITRKWLWAVIPAMVLLFVFNRQVFDFVFSAVGGFYFDKYGREANGYVSTMQYGQMILYFLFSIYSYIVLDEEVAEESDIGLRNLLLLATALQCFAPLHVIASRMNYYFMVFIPATITRVSTHSKVEYRKLTQVAVIVMEIFFIIYFFTRKGDSLHIFDYKFF